MYDISIYMHISIGICIHWAGITVAFDFQPNIFQINFIFNDKIILSFKRPKMWVRECECVYVCVYDGIS